MSTSTIEKSTFKLSFSGHETFPFRYTWLKKAIDGVSADSNLFQRDDALVVLGVGKNMVDSIKYWATTLKLIEDITSVAKGEGGHRVTSLGSRLLLDNGWDPYLEDGATLWLLHWFLANAKTKASTWFYAFNKMTSIEFTKEQMQAELNEFARQNSSRVTPNTLGRDIDCFIRTYVPAKASSSASILEDTLDCPLVELELVFESGQKGLFVFSRGDKKSLPDELLMFAMLEYWNRVKGHGDVLSVEELTYSEGSPGLVFKLDEDSIIRRLERFERLSGGQFAYDETSGLRQVYRRGSAISSEGILNKYYGRKHD